MSESQKAWEELARTQQRVDYAKNGSSKAEEAAAREEAKQAWDRVQELKEQEKERGK